MKSLTKHIPNTLTMLNLCSGGIACVFALERDYRMAMLFIVIGAVFDFFDGMSARLLKVSSPIGKELDSLADDISFGLAPSLIVFSLLGEMTGGAEGVMRYLPYTAFIMAAFSGLRLAKFNLDERQSESFIGLPTPANALLWSSLAVGSHDFVMSLHPFIIFVGIVFFFLAAGGRDTDVFPEIQKSCLAEKPGEISFSHCILVSACGVPSGRTVGCNRLVHTFISFNIQKIVRASYLCLYLYH